MVGRSGDSKQTLFYGWFCLLPILSTPISSTPYSSTPILSTVINFNKVIKINF